MVGVSLAAFTLSASIFAMFLYLTLYLQEVLGYGPFAAGRSVPPPHHAGLPGGPGGRQADRPGPGPLPARAGSAARGPGLRPDDRVQADSAWTVLLPGFIVAGIGVGITNPGPGLGHRCRWCRPSGAAWPPGRPAPSARSASPPASPDWGPCSSARSGTNTTSALDHVRRPAGRPGPRGLPSERRHLRERRPGGGRVPSHRRRQGRADQRLPDRVHLDLQPPDGHRLGHRPRRRRRLPGPGPPAGLRAQHSPGEAGGQVPEATAEVDGHRAGSSPAPTPARPLEEPASAPAVGGRAPARGARTQPGARVRLRADAG